MPLAFGLRDSAGRPVAEKIVRRSTTTVIEDSAPGSTVAAPTGAPGASPPPTAAERSSAKRVLEYYLAQKAAADEFNPAYMSSGYGSEVPKIWGHPLVGIDVYYMAKYNPVLAAIIQTLRSEILRKLPEVRPAFAARCPTCEWEGEKAVDKCPECGGQTVKPNPQGKQLIEKLMRAPSETRAPWSEVLEWLVDDANIIDDSFVLVRKNYAVDPTTGEANPVAILGLERVDPTLMRVLADARGRWVTKDGKGLWTCPEHRLDNLQREAGRCIKAGKDGGQCPYKLYPVRWVTYKDNNPELGYFDDEVIHWSIYYPTPFFGFSPVLTCWAIAVSILNLERMYGRELEQNRPPKGILTFVTSNPESLLDAITSEEELAKRDPMHIMKLAMEATHEKAGGQWIPLSYSSVEMDMTAHYDRMRKAAAAVYKVQGLFMGDTVASGGLNNERLQITVGLRVIERFHTVMHDRLFDPITRAMGITDWVLRFPNPVDADVDRMLERRLKNVELAERMLALGAEIKDVQDDDWTFAFTGTLRAPAKPDPFGSSPWDDHGDGYEAEPGSKKWKEDHPDEDHIAQVQEALARAGRPGGRQESAFTRVMEALWRQMAPDLAERFAVFRDPGPAKQAAREVIDRVVSELRFAAERMTAGAMLEGLKAAGVAPGQAGLLRPALEALQQKSPLWRAFAGLNDSATAKVHRAIEDAFLDPHGYDPRSMVERMREVVDLETYRLERIARNETQHAINVGREIGYREQDPDDKFNYYWAGPNDHRTTPICKAIKSRVGAGKPLGEIAAIVREESEKGMADDPKWEYREWHPHYSCRHRLVRRVLAG